jgi:hypothetical protein
LKAWAGAADASGMIALAAIAGIAWLVAVTLVWLLCRASARGDAAQR